MASRSPGPSQMCSGRSSLRSPEAPLRRQTLRRMLWEMESAEAAAHSQEDEDHSADGHTWIEEPRRQTATVRPWVLGPLFCQPVA